MIDVDSASALESLGSEEFRPPDPRLAAVDGSDLTLSIQLCPKKGINPTILLWGWDWNHQTYSREGYGCLG